MSFTVDRLLRRLAELEGDSRAERYIVAFSGGLDSTVLLHALAAARERLGVPLLAVHCNHGLQAAADRFEAHCRDFAERLAIPFVTRRLRLEGRDRLGPEAAAREARYAALRALTGTGDVVLSAHHEDDQAETLILNLLRGSGPGGVAGIGVSQAFGAGRLWRPLLDVPRKALRDYARDAELTFVEDPTNRDSAFDRNWLRQEIMPRLSRRWPGAAARLRRSAELASEAQTLQNELADLDLAVVSPHAEPPDVLSVPALRDLTPPRRRNVLRRAIARCGLPPAPGRRLVEAAEVLTGARRDAHPLVRWNGAELRRYRDRLFVLSAPAAALSGPPSRLPADGAALELGAGLGRLRLVTGSGGIGREHVGDGLEVRFRVGGERLRPHGRRETHQLKKLLQEKGIVPWMRGNIPLLYAHDSLIAVADLWVAHAAWNPSGLAVRWEGRPRLD